MGLGWRLLFYTRTLELHYHQRQRILWFIYSVMFSGYNPLRLWPWRFFNEYYLGCRGGIAASDWSFSLKFDAISVTLKQWTVENCIFTYCVYCTFSIKVILYLVLSHGPNYLRNWDGSGCNRWRGDDQWVSRSCAKDGPMHSEGFTPPSPTWCNTYFNNNSSFKGQVIINVCSYIV